MSNPFAEFGTHISCTDNGCLVTVTFYEAQSPAVSTVKVISLGAMTADEAVATRDALNSAYLAGYRHAKAKCHEAVGAVPSGTVDSGK